MKLTKGQDAALAKMKAWLEDETSDWQFILKGYAGSGKTTLLQIFINDLDKKPICCAPTGKAASVLRAKLKGVPVRTFHQVLYQPNGKSVEKLMALEQALAEARADGKSDRKILIEIQKEQTRLANERINFSVRASHDLYPGRLVIIDESSMVSERMRDDLHKTGVKALFVGDDFQLPPVNARDWFADAEPDARLTEITRQAMDSPILRLSMQIRERSIVIDDYKTGDCIVTTKSQVTPEQFLEADQVLTGGNASRQKINRFFRSKLWGKDASRFPLANEKMICLKNNHHKLPPWINGIMFKTTKPVDMMEDSTWGLFADYEGAELLGVEFYLWNCVANYGEDLAEEHKLDVDMRQGMFEADYAYAITVHKSQGSEWPYVIVADDHIQIQNRVFRQRWLYTAVTRAKERLLYVGQDKA